MTNKETTDKMTEVGILKWMIKEYEKRGGGYSQIEALKYAIRNSQAIESAEGELGFNDMCDWLEYAFYRKGKLLHISDDDYRKIVKVFEEHFTPILANAKLRIEELKKEIEKYQCNTGWAESIRLGKELQSLKKKNDELIVKNTKALKYLYEFRILKDKLTVEKLVKIIEKSIIDCGSYEVFDIAQALIKDLEI